MESLFFISADSFTLKTFLENLCLVFCGIPFSRRSQNRMNKHILGRGHTQHVPVTGWKTEECRGRGSRAGRTEAKRTIPRTALRWSSSSKSPSKPPLFSLPCLGTPWATQGCAFEGINTWGRHLVLAENSPGNCLPALQSYPQGRSSDMAVSCGWNHCPQWLQNTKAEGERSCGR